MIFNEQIARTLTTEQLESVAANTCFSDVFKYAIARKELCRRQHAEQESVKFTWFPL